MLMSLPARTKNFKPPATWTYTIKLLNHQRELELNNDVCVDCGICIHACPLDGQVISWGSTPNEHVVVDVARCVHCGVCAYFCPSGALKLFINGEERIELKEPAGEIERHSLPDIKGELLSHKKTGAPVKKYLRGSLKIPGDLDTRDAKKAIDACPTGALVGAVKGLEFEESKCFYCDACSRATNGKIVVSRTFLLVDLGDGISPVVKRMVERLMDERAASRIIKGASGHKAREKVMTLLDNTKN